MRELLLAVGCFAASMALTGILHRGGPVLVGALLGGACGLAAWALAEPPDA